MTVFGVIISLFFLIILVFNMLFERKQNVPENIFNSDDSIHAAALLNYLTVFSVGLCIIGILFPIVQIPVIVRLLGEAISVCGIVVFIMSFSKLYYNWWLSKKKGEVKIFVTDGIYKISRTPEAAGVLMFFAGSLIAFFSPATVSAMLVVCVLCAFRIKEKEQYLSKHYVKAYGGYKKRVNLLWGKKKYPLAMALEKAEGKKEVAQNA